jgi:hypothetical protein
VQHIAERSRIKQGVIRMEVMLHLSPKIPGSRAGEVFEQYHQFFVSVGIIDAERNVLWKIGSLIKAGKKERKRKPYKKGRVVGVVAVVVILATIVPAVPVAATVPSIGVVPLTPVSVVPVTSVSVVPITPVIVAVVIAATAVVNGGMTRMAVTSLR